METTTTPVSLDRFQPLLHTRVIGRAAGWPNELWDSIDSTNIRALDLASQGAPEGVVVVARQQTAGRGRLGRTWVSPPDAGLYLSLILRPRSIANASIPLISLAVGVATSAAIKRVTGICIGLKWVNDIVFDGKKLGGILCEMQTSQALVVGVGINIQASAVEQMPAEVRAKAASLEAVTEAPVDVSVLAAELCGQIENAYGMLLNRDNGTLLRDWKHHSVTLGRDICAIQGANEIRGRALDLAADGALIVQTATGETVHLHAGEVTIRNIDGSYV